MKVQRSSVSPSLVCMLSQQSGVAGARRRSKENRSHRSGAVSDPRMNPGGASVRRIGLIAPACLCGGDARRVPGDVLGQVTAAAPTHTSEHASCVLQEAHIVVVTQHPKQQSETVQKNQKHKREEKTRADQ